jgi:hypothetical protein
MLSLVAMKYTLQCLDWTQQTSEVGDVSPRRIRPVITRGSQQERRKYHTRPPLIRPPHPSAPYTLPPKRQRPLFNFHLLSSHRSPWLQSKLNTTTWCGARLPPPIRDAGSLTCFSTNVQLGVSVDVEETDLKKAYRKAAMKVPILASSSSTSI